MCFFYYSLAPSVVRKPCIQICAESFELRASEGRDIITFYLLKNVHDGKGAFIFLNFHLFGL